MLVAGSTFTIWIIYGFAFEMCSFLISHDKLYIWLYKTVLMYEFRLMLIVFPVAIYDIVSPGHRGSVYIPEPIIGKGWIIIVSVHVALSQQFPTVSDIT